MYPSNFDTAVHQVGAQASPYLAVGQNLLNLGTSIYNNERTISANKDMAEKAYANDLVMWERNNQYNAPSAQMARLKMAGLNPNLVYGNGSVVGNSSGSIPKFNPPNIEYNYQAPNILGTLGSYLDLKAKQAQIDNTQAQTNAVNLQTAINTASKDYTIQTRQNQFWNSLAETGIKRFTEQKLQAESPYFEMNAKYNNAMNAKQIEFKNKSIDVMNKTLEKFSADITGANQANALRQLDLNLYNKIGATNSGIGGFGRLALDLIRILKGR